MVTWMINKVPPYPLILALILLLMLPGCGSEFAKMRNADLAYLNLQTLDDIQLFSGQRDIIFNMVEASETGASGYKELQDQSPFIIFAHTPGQVVEYDSTTAELAIWFDALIPPLVYKDNGRGVELITVDFKVGPDQYLRHDRLINRGIGASTFLEPYYLSRLLAKKAQKPPKIREADGIEIDENDLDRD